MALISVLAKTAVTGLLLCLPLQTQNSPSGSKSAKATQSEAKNGTTFSGQISNGIYQNVHFGFTCRIPQGWVIETKEFAEGTPNSQGTHLLLSALQHSPGLPDTSVNSAIIITAEDQTLYPDMVEAADYFGPMTEFIKSKGFQVVREPYQVRVGGEDLDRADFRKDLDQIAIYQSTLVTIERDYILSFTFIAGSQQQVDDLLGGLAFRSHTGPSRSKPKKEKPH